MADNYNNYDYNQRPFGQFRAGPAPPPPPPPPPPLPQPQSRKAVFARLAGPFIGASRPPSSSGDRTFSSGFGFNGPAPTAPQLTARNVNYNLQLPIVAISAHSDGDKAVIAGREILRIIRITNSSIQELANLRLPGEQKKLPQFDVKWGTAPQKNTIATAGTNGVICLYDTEMGRLDRQLKEHGRQVHKLAFNLANGNLLLSASQDGTIKLWDLRERRSRLTFLGKSDAVRDVQFNAANAVEFAAAFDNGTIQRWDYRKENIYERKINAHNGPAFTVDWHPDGKHCASGGRDKAVKVWDFYADSRRKPKHTISTMSSVAKVTWRPINSKYNYNQSTELATVAINNDNRILLWDLKRPFVPSRVMEEHTGLPTGILWRDEDILWSGSKDGTFVQNDVPFAARPVENLPHGAFSWAPNGEFTFAAQRRGRARRGHGSRVTFDLDDDLAVRDDRRRHSHSGSINKPKTSLRQESVLDGTIKKYTPIQTCARVEIPVLFDKEAFAFFAERYVIDLKGATGGKEISLAEACRINALIAWKAQKFQDAQSWRIIRQAVLAEDEAEEKERQKKMPTSVPGTANIVAWRALGLATGDPSIAGPSGGSTPLAGPLHAPLPGSPLSMQAVTPRAEKREDNNNGKLELPQNSFTQDSIVSSTGTDAEDSALDAAVPQRKCDVSSEDEQEKEGEEHKKTERPALTVDTNSPVNTRIRSTDTVVPVRDTSRDRTHGHHPQMASVDENQNLPLFTASTERSDPMAAPSPPGYSKPTTTTTITSSPPQHSAPKPTPTPAYTPHRPSNSQHHPSNSQSTLPDSFSASPNLARQLSLVSELTSSSYNGVPGSMTTEDSPPSPQLAAITEESHFSPATHPLPALQVNNTPAPRAPSPPSTPSPPAPWSVVALTSKLLEHLTETGELQFAATLILLLSSRVNIAPHVTMDVLATYTAHLARVIDRPDLAAHIRKVAGMDEGMWNVAVDLSCGVCGRAVGGRGGGWCSDCGASGCVICGALGKGRRWTVCAMCGHGGCEGCVNEWFLAGEEEMGECAAVGCGCVCLPR